MCGRECFTGEILGHSKRVELVSGKPVALSHASSVVKDDIIPESLEILGYLGKRHLFDAVELVLGVNIQQKSHQLVILGFWEGKY